MLGSDPTPNAAKVDEYSSIVIIPVPSSSTRYTNLAISDFPKPSLSFERRALRLSVATSCYMFESAALNNISKLIPSFSHFLKVLDSKASLSKT